MQVTILSENARCFQSGLLGTAQFCMQFHWHSLANLQKHVGFLPSGAQFCVHDRSQQDNKI